MRWLLPLTFLAVGCGASPVAPTVVVPAVTQEPVRPVYAFDRWSEVVPVRHCAGPEIDASVVAYVSTEMARVSGLPLATSGPCTVEWVIEPFASYGSAYCDRAFDGHAITHARLVFKGLYAANDIPVSLHEAGHALGLVHSGDRRDLMYPGPVVDHFSDSELALLRDMYGR